MELQLVNMAAALQGLGGGLITAVDLIKTKDSFKPSAKEQLEKTGLSTYAKIIRMQSGYTWFLHDEISRNTKDNGWIIFDDYNWTYSSRSTDKTDGITHRELSDTELKTPHVKEIFELLVKQHPNYGNLYLLNNSDWAVAQKKVSDTKKYRVEYDFSIKDIGAKVLLKIIIDYLNKSVRS